MGPPLSVRCSGCYTKFRGDRPGCWCFLVDRVLLALFAIVLALTVLKAIGLKP